MPLVIRSKDGTPNVIDRPVELEYRDNEGRLALVIIQNENGSLRVMTPGSPQFRRYAQATGQKASTVHVHEDYGD